MTHSTASQSRAAPAELADSELDAANGGVLISLLLPAVQKVQEASLPPAGAGGSSHPGGCNFALGDGSVRF